MNFLIQPKKYKTLMADEGSKAIMEKTVAFFETMGKERLLDDYNKKLWYREFIDFLARERIFSKLLTPKEYAEGDPDCRWDTARNSEYSELLAFYGLGYWYCFQVTILGLGPIWMSPNETAKKKAARLLREGAIFAFGLSERTHGADIYSTETMLTPKGDGTYVANGEKYYIGNGNEAEMVSTLGKVKDGTDEYTFFVTNYRHKAYELKKNVISHQEYVSNFALHDYPITEDDILSRGPHAWDSALNTVNIGKFNIGPASIGVAEHCFYEAITHASNRILYGMRVTDMPHVRKNFMDAWLRLVAMKMYQRRSTDYFRNSKENDRRYLLYNPTSKMKVTLQSEDVINLLWDVIAAKGFEKDTYFHMAAADIRGPSKLEGTVHVNVQLIRKFMKNYFFNPAEYEPVKPDFSLNDDLFLFNQGPTKGLGKVQFHDYKPVFEAFKGMPNVATFIKQIEIFKEMLEKAGPDKMQDMDPSWSLPLGEMFSIVVYGQLILEQAQFDKVDGDVINQIFDFMVRDFAHFALQIYGNHNTTDEQREFCTKIMHIKAAANPEQYNKVWEKYVSVLNGEYAMNEK
ncbi:MAG TPA: acyl-CoA dehydrogenase family protein [Deltaproteobacteria bacterium]|jgi:acyl-CoA dehydrogenase|nr:acyl-CoA dehydrogenase [Deltaproteobacteria bacterium]HRW81446.1 acyl-CoA dehydrogenase family protein [Desulfomonilia bacterium]HNQ86610.1 acyl-CoA dehydrogenase family protein [Deltaproteobacteria bacterium]HNS90322.1 acyl-CoA dehydrogenase family protein [Deltaproteobacteria bacterium]HOA45370.1 acyl-CoA dehydrogenase family protein [Deltaproteobacteria bacterium]